MIEYGRQKNLQILNPYQNENPKRFMFQLKKADLEDWKSQFAISNEQPTSGTLFLTVHGSSLRSQIVTLNKRQGQHLKI